MNIRFLQEQSFLFRLSALVLLCFLCMSLLSMFSAGLLILFAGFNPLNAATMGGLSDPQTLFGLKVLQMAQALGLFVIPSLLFPIFCGSSPQSYLKTEKLPAPALLLLVLALAYFSAPLLELSNQLNKAMSLPEILAPLEDWMKGKENQMAALTKAFLQMESPSALLVNLFLIAVLPAVGEEFLFRGVIQRLFIEKLKNPHLGIWLAAVVFSALHFQFYGFLPRLLLGALFGYLFFLSGNIWLPVLAHFVNNATVVVFSYLYQHRLIRYDIEAEAHLHWTIYVVCAVGSVLLINKFSVLSTDRKDRQNNNSTRQ